MILKEGGNVFKDSSGQALTRRIKQGEIPPTINWLEQITGLDFTEEKHERDNLPVKWLGSTGRKVDSGDLDLSVDANEISKDQLVAQLANWCKQVGVDPARYIKKTGSAVHFFTAIDGNPKNGFAQTDFMFSNKPSWTQFVLSSDPASKFKGALRNILMNSMSKALGYKLNQNDGIMDRTTNELITDDPNQVAKMLLSPNATSNDLYSVEAILKSLEADPKRAAKIADFKAHMEREGVPFDDGIYENTDFYTEYTEVSFMARLRDRIVNQGMQVIVEKTSLAEGVRIEHPEDMLFDQKPSTAISQALKGLTDSAHDPQGTTTVKWDGKPAIIFGRKPNGDFVLTDKSGFLAKGYDGLATSTDHIVRMMNMRAGERGELINLYKKLFPLLRKAVPPDFRGYIQGDLLYSNRPPIVGKDYVFTPNTVKYSVPADSELGQKISTSEAAVAIHTSLDTPGGSVMPIRAAALNDVPGLLIIDPSLKEPRDIKLNSKIIADLTQLATTYGADMDRVFNPAELRSRRISNFPALIKTYINSRVRSGSYNNLVGGFGPWVLEKEPAKSARIFEWANENKRGVAAIFQAFLDLSTLKNDLVRQLDAQAHDVQASINGEPGHEGYVGNDMKYVDRFRFSQANFAKNNPELG
jgi:hypothetical protein